MFCLSPFPRPYSTADQYIAAKAAFQEMSVCQYLQATFKTSNKSCSYKAELAFIVSDYI